MKHIAILGSTGSIGRQTLEVAAANPDVRVHALAAGKNIRLLEEQIRQFRPELAAVWDEKDAAQLRVAVADLDVKVVSGMDGLIETAVCPQSTVLVTAIVGMIGIIPTIEAIRAGKDIALANKETLVTAGHIIMPLARERGVQILPVDSEHSAIFQSLNGEKKDQIDQILLTASGGPFRGFTRDRLAGVRVEDALKHPNWAMGRKITIDSASMVNKGLEVIEAKWLFSVRPDQIHVLIQPQSVIHSMVQFCDGAVIGQLGTPDMKLPIQYALFYPDRRYLAGRRLDFAELGSISFEEPDTENFLGLPLARRALEAGGSMPTVFNAANEKAVAAYLAGKIGFLEIYDMITYCMDMHTVTADPDVDRILAAEQEAYERIERKWQI